MGLLMRISIIIPTYNAEDKLNCAIESVNAQDYDDIELIIIDGGSTDGTLDIIKKNYKLGVITKWISESDKGIYDAFNKGIELASGDYIYFLGADDFLFSSETISTIAKTLKNQSVDVYSGGVYVVDEVSKIEFYVGNSFARNKNDFKGEKMIPHQGMLVKADILKINNFDCKYKIAADYKLFLNLYMYHEYKFVFSDLPVAYYSQMGVSGNDIKTLINEQNEIKKEFGVVYNNGEKNIYSKIRKMLKRMVLSIGIFEYIMLIYKKRRLNKKKHSCKNYYCRICNNN